MSLGLNESRRHRRQRLRWTLFKWLLALGIIVAAGGYGYHTGRSLAAHENDRLATTIAALTDRVNDLESRNAVYLAQLAAAEATQRDWQIRYERDVARGAAKDILDLVQQKLATGVEADRLKALVSATEARRECRREADRKLLPVPIRSQAAQRSGLVFGRGAVTLIVAGAPARNAEGDPENWFDTAKPLTVRLLKPGGATTEFAGLLPITPSLIVGDREYNFHIAAAKMRGHVDVTGESCRFP
jgi:hypothetical protein